MVRMDPSTIQNISDYSTSDAQQKALHVFEELKESQTGWQICASTVTDPANDHNHSVQFFCFQVIEQYLKTRYAAASPPEQATLRAFLMTWLGKYCQRSQAWPNFLANKAAQVLALAFVQDYPARWEAFFSDLLGVGGLVELKLDVYLRVLVQVDSEVVDRDIPHTPEEAVRNTSIKDAMRVRCVPALVESWMSIITTYEVSHPDLVNTCLDVIGAYVSWIDITLIANERFVGVLLRFFSSEALRVKACSCVLEIISKGMEPMAKVALIESFTELFNSAGVLAIKEDEDVDYLQKLSQLVNGMGLQLIAAWQKLSKGKDTVQTQQALESVFRKLPMLLHFLGHENDDVSAGVIGFCHSFLTISKQIGQRSAEHKQHLKELLFTIILKMKYDDDYNFDHEGEDEAEFMEYRKELRVLFNNMGSLEPELVLSSVQEMCKQSWNNWRNVRFQDVELSISLLYQLVEALPKGAGNREKGKTRVSLGQAFSSDPTKGTAVQDLMRLMITSDVSHYRHCAVSRQYLETIIRYDKFFSCEPQYLPDVLIAFLDERGLKNPSGHVRSRSSYLFSRFVKDIAKPHLKPYLEEVLKRMQDLLALHSPADNGVNSLLSPQDQLFMYETTGVLIIQSTFPPEKKQELMRQLLAPIINKFDVLLESMIAQQDPISQQAYADCLAQAMAFSSRASKGFSNQQTMKQCDCVSVYTEVLTKFLCALDVPVQRHVLHPAVRQFLHRMVVCLDQEVLPYIPVAMEHLLRAPEVREVCDFIPLINQVVAKYKKEIVRFVATMLMPLLRTVFGVLGAPVDERDQVVQTECAMLRRAYFSFLSCLVANQVTDVLLMQTPADREQVLLTLTQGGVELADPQCQKPCFSVLRHLVEEWGTTHPDFVVFAYGHVLPACFLAPMKPTFDLSDAQTVLVLNECALCLRSMAQKLGQEYYQYLQCEFLPSHNVTTIIAQEFCSALRGDGKSFKLYFKAFFDHVRS